MTISCQGLWIKRKKGSRAAQSLLRRHTKKLFYRVWLRCGGSFTDSTEQGAAECTQQKFFSLCWHSGQSPIRSMGWSHLFPPRAFQPIAQQCQQALLVDVHLLFPLSNVVIPSSLLWIVSYVDEGWTFLVWMRLLSSLVFLTGGGGGVWRTGVLSTSKEFWECSD